MSQKTRIRTTRLPFIQVGAILIVVGLVAFGFFKYVVSPPTTSNVPGYIGSLKLINLVQGEQARSQINAMHGETIDLNNAYIAGYQSPYGAQQLTVWLGDAGSRSAAEALISRMSAAIAQENTGFTNPRQIQVSGHDVWQADGAGGSFYFYISSNHDDRIVWLSISGSGVQGLLETSLEAF